MNSSTVISFELFSGFSAREKQLAPGVARLDETGRRNLMDLAAVRHATHTDLSVVYAVLAARAASVDGNAEVGILLNNGPWNLFGSCDIDQRAREAGARFINPLRFPATLVSHVPTRTAQELNCTSFAYGVGYDGAAFLDALLLGSRLVAAGHAQTVLVLAVCHGGPLLSRIAHHAGLTTSLLDVSLCARVGRASGRGLPLTLLWNRIGSVETHDEALRSIPSTPESAGALSAAAAVDLSIAAHQLSTARQGQSPCRLSRWGAVLALGERSGA